MIEVSSRHGLLIGALVLLALLPEFAHRGARFLHEDCRDPSALLRSANDGATVPPAPEALRRMPGTQLAGHRIALPERAGTLDFHVVHAFNPSLVYQPAEFYFIDDRRPQRRTVEILERNGERLPVHRAHFETRGRNRVTVVGYLTVFDSKAVESGYLAELASAPSQLFTGRKPVWLFFGHAEVKPGAREAAERTLHEALTSAWDRYRAACVLP